MHRFDSDYCGFAGWESCELARTGGEFDPTWILVAALLLVVVGVSAYWVDRMKK